MSEQLAEILAQYQLAINEALTAASAVAAAKKQELLEAHPDLVEELLEYFSSTAEPSIADTIDFCKPAPSTVTVAHLGEQSAISEGTQFGDYELLEEIARGGMGVVYKARQKKADRIVALKMILSGQLAGEEEVRRFHAEAKAAANLDHPGIVPVYDVGEIDGQNYFSMGFVEGGSLSKRLKDGPLAPRVAVEYMKSIAKAVAFAHHHGVIHRDLKPSNILVGDDGQPRVTDFGLSKQLGVDNNLTMTGQVMGTPSYMPPEQAVGNIDAIGTTSDVYSLGAIFYCLLTGRPPFQAASHVEIFRQVVEQNPVGLRLLNRSIPKDIETICLKCLRKESAQRYPSSQALADDLERWFNDEPIRARPFGMLERSWLWCKRRPTLVGTVVAAAILLGLVSWYLTARGNDAQATRLVDGLLGADTSNVGSMIATLSDYRKWASDDLAAAYENPPADLPNAQLHAALAMLPHDVSVLKTLREQLLTVSPGQFQYVRDAMNYHKDDLIDDYWELTKDTQRNPAIRFQAACALATYDPQNDNWKNHEFVEFIANHLVRVRFSALGPWQEALRDVRADLVDPLVEISRDDTLGESQRIYATETLANFLQDDPTALARLLLDADADAFQPLFSALALHRREAIDELQQVLALTLKPDWKDQPSTFWQDIATDARVAIESAQGMIDERFAFCQTLPWEQLSELNDKLSAAGYRPTRVRPYSDSKGLMVAAIWTRDGGRFELETDLTADQLPPGDAPAAKDGLVPVDFAVQSAKDANATLFLILWCEPDTADEQRRLLSDLNEKQLTAAQATLTEAGFDSQATIAVWYDEAGERHYGGIWSNRGAPSELNTMYAGFELVDQPQWDLAAARPANLTNPLESYRQLLADTSELPMDVSKKLLEQPQVRLQRGRARFRLAQFEEALEDLDLVVAQQPLSTSAIYLRALALVALKKPELSAQPLAKYLELEDDPIKGAYVKIVHAAWSGDNEQAFAQMNATTETLTQHSRGLYFIACAAALSAQTPQSEDSAASKYRTRALELLASAIAKGYSDADEMASEVDLVSLHSDPRFLELLAQINPPVRYTALWRADVAFESRLVTSAPQEMLARLREFVTQDYRPIGITIGTTSDGALQASVVLHRPTIPDELREQLAIQQSTAATALLRLGETSLAWPLLTHQADSRLRSYLLHRLVPYKVKAAPVLERLSTETDVSRQRALILAIGEWAAAGRLTDEQRSAATNDLARRYANDPDAGVHAAAEWALRQLDSKQEIARVENAFANGQIVGNRQWYLTNVGQQTMVVLTPSKPFLMGSPVTEVERYEGPSGKHEIRHRRRIERRFAIAAHEVTVAQFERFRSDHDFKRHYSREPDAPANNVTWYDAAAFCNWLSREENIPRDQWCYETDQDFSEGMTLPPDYLERTGYRLPTEAEWEYACRAASSTARHFGQTEQLLGEYAWYTKNSQDEWTLPVGSLKPNDAGLFDTLGNVCEWCDNWAVFYQKDVEFTGDLGAPGELNDDVSRVLRGGSFHGLVRSARSANRDYGRPTGRNGSCGIRPVRTLTHHTPSQNRIDGSSRGATD